MVTSLFKFLSLSALAVTLSLASGGARAESYPSDSSSARIATEAKVKPDRAQIGAQKRIAKRLVATPNRGK
jgi:hypothetical protein